MCLVQILEAEWYSPGFFVSATIFWSCASRADTLFRDSLIIFELTMRTTSYINQAFMGLKICFITLALLFATSVYASQDFPETPEATIEFVSTELLSSLQELASLYDESPEDFYAGIDRIVAPWIDFDAFYKGVMGRKYYTSASKEQRERFKGVFHTSLIETYGKGLLGVEETKFEVAPAAPPKKPGGSVHVEQTLFSGSGRIAVVYTMGQGEDGRWKLKNVVLEGINLGKTFRNQFARSARENSEDLDLVIDGWSSES